MKTLLRILLLGAILVAVQGRSQADPLQMNYKSLQNGTTNVFPQIFNPVSGFGSKYQYCLTHLTVTVITSTVTANINILDQGTTVYSQGPLTALVEEWPANDPFCIAAGDTMTITNSPNTGVASMTYRGFVFPGLNP